jgi:hypothetical protein
MIPDDDFDTTDRLLVGAAAAVVAITVFLALW